MLSAVSFTGCDSNYDGAVEAEEALIDEDAESALETEFDLANEARPKIVEYLRQDYQAPTTGEQARKQLNDLVAWIDQVEKVLKTPPPAKPGARPPAMAR